MIERAMVVLRHNTQLGGDVELAVREFNALIGKPGERLCLEEFAEFFIGFNPAKNTVLPGQASFVALGWTGVSEASLLRLLKRSAFAQELFVQDSRRVSVEAIVRECGAASSYIPGMKVPTAIALAHNYIIESEGVLGSELNSGRIARTIELLLEPHLLKASSSASRKLRMAKKTTLSLTHDLHIYKAKFFPRMVRALLNLQEIEEGVVFDPFCGSGTALLEAALLGIPSYGCDIDPISQLISRSKVTPFLDTKALNQALDSFTSALHQPAASNSRSAFVFPAELAAKLERRDRVDGTAYAPEIQREAEIVAAAIRSVNLVGAYGDLLKVLASDAVTKKVRYRFVGVGNGRYTIEVIKQSLIERLMEKIERCRQLGNVFSELSTLLGIDISSSTASEGDARDSSTWPKMGESPWVVLTSPPYLPASSGREHYAASRALAFAVLGFEGSNLGYHDAVPSRDLNTFQPDRFPEAMRLMAYLHSDASESADPQRDAMRFQRKAEPTRNYLRDIETFFSEAKASLPSRSSLLLVVAHHHVFYSHRRQELEHTVSGKELYAQIAEAGGLRLEEEIPMQLLKARSSNARPMSKDDYFESVLVFRSDVKNGRDLADCKAA